MWSNSQSLIIYSENSALLIDGLLHAWDWENESGCTLRIEVDRASYLYNMTILSNKLYYYRARDSSKRIQGITQKFVSLGHEQLLMYFREGLDFYTGWHWSDGSFATKNLKSHRKTSETLPNSRREKLQYRYRALYMCARLSLAEEKASSFSDLRIEIRKHRQARFSQADQTSSRFWGLAWSRRNNVPWNNFPCSIWVGRASEDHRSTNSEETRKTSLRICR